MAPEKPARRDLALRQWLASLGLEQYTESLERNDVGLDLLADLSDTDLEKLGVTLGHRKRLLKAIAALAAATGSPKADSSQPPSTSLCEPERRQLTVMFCDLVGSTELSQRLDPEAYRELVRAYQSACAEIITRYDGYIAQYLGDGLLVYFGYPKAHEEDAHRAVRAGLDILETVSRLDSVNGAISLRVGIHTGVVVVGGMGTGASSERLALGDTPNLAARLQSFAQPNTVVLSDRARQLTSGGFEYRDLGLHSLKGIAEPVHLWQALTESKAETRFDAATGGTSVPMVGRDLEAAVLMHAWQRAKSGKGQFVLLCGEPGIGKSRILRSLREKLIDEGISPWQYQCSPYFANSALYPIIDHLERALKFEREEPAESKLDKLERFLDTYNRPIADSDLIGRLLSLPAEQRYGVLSMTPQKQKDETLRALNNIIEAAAKRQAMVIFFEDLHWADPTTLESLEALLARLARSPVLLVATYRPEFSPQWVGQPLVTALTLSRLDPEQTLAIATRVAGGKALPEEIIAQITAKTDGIPLFVEELTKAILELGLLKLVKDGYVLSGPLPPLAIPSTLRDSLMARLDRLAPVKEVAQTGACIGREFQQELLAHISPLSQMQLQKALDSLVVSELLFKRGQPPHATYFFKHALIQEAAYDSILKVKRSQLHAQIAYALETDSREIGATQPELIAYHYTAAEMLEQAIPYWHKAGEVAKQRVALQEAISHLDHALALVQRLPSSRTRDAHELSVRTTLGMTWMALRGYAYAQVGENLQRARELEQEIHPGDHSLQVLWGLWVYTHSIGRVREGLTWAEELLLQATRSNSEDLNLAGHHAASNSYYCLGDFTQVIQHADTSLARYDPRRDRHLADLLNIDPKTAANICKGLAEWALGFPDSAAQIAQEGVTYARTLGHPFNLGWALYFSATALDSWRRDADLCAAKLDEFEHLAQNQRLAFFEHVVSPLFRAVYFFISDRPQEANIKFAESIPSWTASGLAIRLPNLKTLHAQTAALSGQLDVALLLVDEALEQIARPGWEERYFLAEALRAKGCILHRSEDLMQAEACFRKAINVAHQQQAKSWELRATTSYAQLMKRQGRRDEALDLLQPIYDWFTEGRSTKDHIEAKALLDELKA